MATMSKTATAIYEALCEAVAEVLHPRLDSERYALRLLDDAMTQAESGAVEIEIRSSDTASGRPEIVRFDAPAAPECETCGVAREDRTCADCGAEASVIDCGHHAQPAEIAASSIGDRCHVCEDCEAARLEARAASEAARTRCQCGETSGGLGCGKQVDDADAVTLAWVPSHLRDMIVSSRTTARAWEHAIELRVSSACAEAVIESDGADWARVSAVRS